MHQDNGASSGDNNHTPQLPPKPAPDLNGKQTHSGRGIENLREVLARLQQRLQEMGEQEGILDDTHEELITSVGEIDKDLETLQTDQTDTVLTDGDATSQLSVKVDREARQALRRVQEHLLNAQLEMGAKHETLGLVEVVHHPNNGIGSLNYVTPRRKTAWVSAEHVRQGIDHLKSLDRVPRVTYIEGLLPPLFARNLRQLEMEIELETPLMVFLRDGFRGELPPRVDAADAPYDLQLETVTDVRSAEVWWYVWQNAYYDVLTLGVEPLFVGRVAQAAKMGKQINITALRDGFPFGVARATVHNNTAHIVGIAVFKEMHTPGVTQLLYQEVLHKALEQGCDLVFAPGEAESERQIVRELGFIDFGSVVCYAAQVAEKPNTQTDDTKPLVQPILNLR